VNISASGKRRAKLEEVAGTKAIPVLVDGDRIITDSDEALSYLEHSYETDPEELGLHRRELSPTVYGTSLSGSRRPQRDCARPYRKRVSRYSRSWTSPPIRKVKDCTRC
jgi:glutathione S-transferase